MVEDGPVWASKVLEEIEKGVKNEIDGAGADPDEGGTGNGNDVVVVEILGRSTGAMRKLDWGTGNGRLGQHMSRLYVMLCDGQGKRTLVASLSTRPPTRPVSPFIVP